MIRKFEQTSPNRLPKSNELRESVYSLSVTAFPTDNRQVIGPIRMNKSAVGSRSNQWIESANRKRRQSSCDWPMGEGGVWWGISCLFVCLTRLQIKTNLTTPVSMSLSRECSSTLWANSSVPKAIHSRGSKKRRWRRWPFWDADRWGIKTRWGS